MGLNDVGSYNSSDNSRKMYENTYYSRLKVRSNTTGNTLSYSFKSGMVIVSISKKKEDNTYEDLASIYITPTKAAVLSKMIDMVNEEIANNKKASSQGYGIITGLDQTVSTLILRTEDTDAGIMPAITIGKISGSGEFVNRVDFSFNINYDFGIKWDNVDDMKSENVYFNDIEWNQFCKLIKDFANASNGAYAYATLDLARYDYRALMNKLNPIYDKLGIERQTYGSNRSYSGNNYFNSNNNSNNSARNTASSTNKSYDQLIDSIEDSSEEELPFD